MKILLSSILLTVTVVMGPQAFSKSLDCETDNLKKQILELAKSYEGKADPDQSLQKNLEVLVNELVAKKTMPPVSERLLLIAGAWKQVWGPYDYRNDDGGIDPTLGVFEIYQVVSPQGYYYNVAPYYPNGDKSVEQIGLLRGEYKLASVEENKLAVRFTDYPGVESRPTGLNLWELPALAEAGTLPNPITIVPSDIVKRFFKGGTLDEIYTDEDMRILYGQKVQPSTRRFLYIMTRVHY